MRPPFFLFLFLANALSAQDIYDYTHSRAYARYLLQSQQYTLAAEEYERLIFLRPDNDTLRADLLRAYRKGDTLSVVLNNGQNGSSSLGPKPACFTRNIPNSSLEVDTRIEHAIW